MREERGLLSTNISTEGPKVLHGYPTQSCQLCDKILGKDSGHIASTPGAHAGMQGSGSNAICYLAFNFLMLCLWEHVIFFFHVKDPNSNHFLNSQAILKSTLLLSDATYLVPVPKCVWPWDELELSKLWILLVTFWRRCLVSPTLHPFFINVAIIRYVIS